MNPSELFDIDEVFRRLRDAAPHWPRPALNDLRDRGHDSPFEVLVGSLISTRTRDETTLPVCLRLFEQARTPEQVAALSVDELATLLHGAGFARTKAADVKALAERLMTENHGQVPHTLEALTAYRGIGPKVAALTLALGFGQPSITVDVHVHRIVNRWGLVATRTPEQSRRALEERLPRAYWTELNERLVPFGKVVCRPRNPRCDSCILSSMCLRVGVESVSGTAQRSKRRAGAGK